MKKTIYNFMLCMATLFALSLQSCSDLLDQFQDDNRYVLHFDFNGFESVSTRAGESQFSISSGDKMYLDFNGFETYASYSSGSTWTLNDVPPTTKISGTLKAYFAKSSMTARDVCLSGSGSFTNTKNGVSASVTLSPLTARLRFKGDMGKDVSIQGLDYYKSFDTSSYEFTKSNGETINLRVAGDGYTPYVYVMFSGATKIQITYNGKTSDKTFNSDVLQPGKSGCLNLANLQFESEGSWVDVTGLITNPSFDGNNYSGWEGTPWGAAGPEGNAEHWNTNFDTYQVLHNLQSGTYRLSVQGFYRMGGYDDDYNAYNNGTFESLPTLYAISSIDDAETGFVSMSSAALTSSLGGWDALVGGVYYVPNDMIAAHYWFEAGYYNDNSLTCKVGNDGELTIGISKYSTISGDWICVDNWKLEYLGEYETPLPTSDYSADTDNVFHLTASKITSPYTEPTEGSIAAMLDNDPATFWHSVWSAHSVSQTEQNDGHYFQVEEADLTGNFAFGFTRRNIASDQISQWAVYGVPSDNPNATKSQCQLLARVNTPLGSRTESYISPVILNRGFKTIRFYAEETSNNRVYFHLAEFRLYPAKQGAGIVGSIYALPNDGTDHNGREYVDLGLSVKWATCNVGASSPEDYGDYFAWGETKPKSIYSRNTYFDTNDGGKTFNKYHSLGDIEYYTSEGIEKIYSNNSNIDIPVTYLLYSKNSCDNIMCCIEIDDPDRRSWIIDSRDVESTEWLQGHYYVQDDYYIFIDLQAIAKGQWHLRLVQKYAGDWEYSCSKTILDPEDDAAHVNWGGAWRMPTKAELEELQNNCTWTLAWMNDICGYKVTSKVNGNSIFLPAAGIREDNELFWKAYQGFFMSSSLSLDLDEWYSFSDDFICLAFYSDFSERWVRMGDSYRFYGISVRPVCP